MSRARAEEVWVAQCIEAALPGVDVAQHDDGSANAMYDLQFRSGSTLFAACEVTAAADQEAIELWNLLNSGGRWIEPGLSGGWLLSLTSQCRAKALRRQAPALLAALEVNLFDWDARDRLVAIGVRDVRQSSTSFPGSIYITLARDSELTGGMVPETGDPLVEWFDEWILDPSQTHNLDKLRRSALPEKHLFVLVPGFSTMPFPAYDILLSNDAPLPVRAPLLPDGLTHAWFMSTWTSGDLFHTDGTSWVRFTKHISQTSN